MNNWLQLFITHDLRNSIYRNPTVKYDRGLSWPAIAVTGCRDTINDDYLTFYMKQKENTQILQNETHTTIEELKPKLRKPLMFQVVLLNDDYTPMDFVIALIELFFYKSRDCATSIMLKVHTEGRAVCGIYTEDVAETKATLVNQYSREHQHPLLCRVETCAGEDV